MYPEEETESVVGTETGLNISYTKVLVQASDERFVYAGSCGAPVLGFAANFSRA